MLRVRTAYNFEDVHLVPAYSALSSRMDVDLTVRFSAVDLGVPLISAAMDTVTEEKMAGFMQSVGSFGVLHRYMSIDEQVEMVKHCVGLRPDLYGANLTAVSVGVNGDAAQRARACVDAGAAIVMLDVAHGDTVAALEFVEKLRADYSDIIISSANIVTAEAARRYLEAGADVLRVGLGSGSACATTDWTGVGYPQLSAVAEIHSLYPGATIVSDGGCRNAADVVKALAAGATAVMSGRLFANYDVAAKPGSYRGMASVGALSDYKKDSWHTPEGYEESVEVLSEEETNVAFADLINHIKIGFSYLGARNIEELRQNARWVEA